MSVRPDVVKKQKTIRKVCKCENCGNEAEMMVTCSLEPDTPNPAKADAASQAASQNDKQDQKLDQDAPRKRVRGTGTCTHCGNEADMWVDI